LGPERFGRRRLAQAPAAVAGPLDQQDDHYRDGHDRDHQDADAQRPMMATEPALKGGCGFVDVRHVALLGSGSSRMG
jgi:hypothetical protein